jgi:hypothetical protein
MYYRGLHRKKRFTSFPSPAGMSLTQFPLGRNNSVMTSLFPPRESLVVTSRLGTGNSRTFFLLCRFSRRRMIWLLPPPLSPPSLSEHVGSHSQSFCVSPVEHTYGRKGRRGGGEEGAESCDSESAWPSILN